ncbi:hypothetical protein LXL04_006455 [Taraxacum kok-saghyz]
MAIDDFCRADGGVVDEVITTVDATIIRRMELEALESKPTLSRKLALIKKISPFMEAAQPMLHDLTLTV